MSGSGILGVVRGGQRELRRHEFQRPARPSAARAAPCCSQGVRAAYQSRHAVVSLWADDWAWPVGNPPTNHPFVTIQTRLSVVPAPVTLQRGGCAVMRAERVSPPAWSRSSADACDKCRRREPSELQS